VINGNQTKLPVFATVGAAFQRFAADFLDYVLLAVPMFLFSLISSYREISRVADRMHGDLTAMHFDWLMIPIQIFSFALYIMLFANVVRRTLLGTNGPRNALGLGWGWREFRILGRWLLVWLITIVLFVPYFVFSRSFLNDSPLVGWLIILLGVISLSTLVVFVFVFCRITTYVTAPSVDANLSLQAAFVSTRGNVLRIFSCFLLIILPFSVVLLVIRVIWGSKLLSVGEGVSLILPVLNATGLLCVVLGMILSALIYKHLVMVPVIAGDIGGGAIRVPETSRH